MRVGILGPLQVTAAGGDPVRVGGARLRALLARLALDAGRVVTVDALAAALWPDDRLTDPAHALQSLVARLRRALPDRQLVRSAPGGYWLDLPPEDVDALRFERLAHTGREALRDREPQLAARRLREALGLWRGDPLAELAEAPFATAAAVRLAELRLAATEDRLAADLATGVDPPALVAELAELVAAHPLRERLRVLQLQTLAAAGRAAEALAAYQRYRELLVDQFGSDPGPELQQAHRAVLRGDRATPAAEAAEPADAAEAAEPADAAEPAAGPATARWRPGNLRAALTSFVGRAAEQTQLAAQLSAGRLVTLVGPGGVGKTRLATTVAASLAAEDRRFPGGVWLVDLAPVSDPDGVPAAVVAALGLREGGVPEPPATARDPVGRLVEALSARELLLVLDNCEHLVEAAARLVEELLGRCRRLRVLATSREPLGVPGEVRLPVAPLEVPASGTPAAEATRSPVLQLFADRAAAVRPGFTVTETNLPAVLEVCRRLDGLPLAVELAAAAVRALPVEELANRLDDRFRLLTGGSRTALPQHRTLRAVVAWSWDRLTDRERQLAARLSVFPATITPEAASQVAAGGGPVLDTLAGLVDRSLLQVVAGTGARYRMLETIRQYGRERLVEAGELDRFRAAHAGYFLTLAEQAAPHLRGPEQVRWLAQLAAEPENLLAALHTARQAGDAGTAVRLVAALSHFWTVSGNHAEAADRLRLGLGVPGGADPIARAVATTAYLLNLVLSGGRIIDTVDQVRARAEAVDLAAAGAAAAALPPLLGYVTGEPAAGQAAADHWLSEPDSPDSTDHWTRGIVWLARSFLDGDQGDLDGMRRDLAAAAGAFRTAGERWGLATALTFRAHTQITLGEFEEAVAALTESVRLQRELDPADPAVMPRVLRAVARAQRGDPGRARAELRELLETGHTGPSTRHLVLARISLGDLARLAGDLAEADRQYRAAGAELGQAAADSPLLRAMLGCGQGHLAVARGDPAAARRWLQEALALALEAPDMPLIADLAVAAARLRWYEGEAAAAVEVLGAGHALRGAPDAYDPDVVALTRALRAELGEAAYLAGYQRGQARDRDRALAALEAQVRRR